jgi:hypothetical protein
MARHGTARHGMARRRPCAVRRRPRGGARPRARRCAARRCTSSRPAPAYPSRTGSSPPACTARAITSTWTHARTNAMVRARARTIATCTQRTSSAPRAGERHSSHATTCMGHSLPTVPWVLLLRASTQAAHLLDDRPNVDVGLAELGHHYALQGTVRAPPPPPTPCPPNFKLAATVQCYSRHGWSPTLVCTRARALVCARASARTRTHTHARTHARTHRCSKACTAATEDRPTDHGPARSSTTPSRRRGRRSAAAPGRACT